MSKKIEGDKALSSGSHILLVEDVITTGGSAIEAIDTFREQGHRVTHMLALVDRCEGGKDRLSEHGIEVVSLFDRTDFLGDD
jgi:orotate phosphoribosyltransferase